MQEEDLQGCLELCTSEISYDIENIENICDNLYLLEYKQFEERDIIDVCKNAYWLTLEKDKTIKVEAFVVTTSAINVIPLFSLNFFVKFIFFLLLFSSVFC